MRLARLGLILALGVASAATTAWPAKADVPPAVAACLEAHAEGQRAEQKGELQSARARYAKCVDFACPDAVRRDCDAWRVRVEQALPSIIIRAKSGNVAPKIWVDGTLVPPARTGLPVDVDPGPHKIRVEADGFRPAEPSITVAAGEKARVIDVELAEAASSTPPPAHATPPPPASPYPYVLGGFGIVSLGVFLGVALDARSTYETLDSSCNPRCNPNDVDSLHRRYVIADVALGIGSAAVIASAIWLLVRASSSRASVTAQASPRP